MEQSGAGGVSGPVPGGSNLRIVFERQYRTSQSEGYHVLVGEARVAHLDLHYTQTNVYATLVIEGPLEEAQILDLIERIDESIVLSAEVPREDLLVTVYQGTRKGLYSDDFLLERRERRETTQERRTARQQRNVN